MRFTASIARGCAAFFLLAACALAPATAAATTPSLLWAEARQVAVLCLVQSIGTSDAAAVETSLCARARDLASRAAPYPVKRVPVGDPTLIDPDTVTLLVHASIERAPGGRMIVFTLRPSRPSEGGDVRFGTAPRAVQLGSGSLTPAVDSALAGALAEILPWQRPSGLVGRPL